MPKEIASLENDQARHHGPVSHSPDSMQPSSDKHKDLLTRFDPNAVGFGILTPWSPSGKLKETGGSNQNVRADYEPKEGQQ
jgi:hypothetical protein